MVRVEIPKDIESPSSNILFTKNKKPVSEIVVNMALVLRSNNRLK
jgi:hypothetical protein